MALFPIAKPKAHSLTGRITQPLLHAAFKAVKRNRGAAGIDKVSINMFENNLAENLAALEQDLKDGSFNPFPLRRKWIPKEPGKFRPLGIPAVRDRVAQEVVRRLLHPTFEPLFHDASFGFRPGRNCHQALERVLKLHAEGYRVVLDADIKGFFDNLPLAIIKEAVAAQVADGNILHLIEKFLRCGVMEDGVFKPTTVGTPQGGVISPLLANIVLNHLDWRLHEHGFRFVRYADDFVVLCQTRAQAEEALTLVHPYAPRTRPHPEPREDPDHHLREGLRPSRLCGLQSFAADARQVSAEVSRQGAGLNRAVPQPGCRSHREAQPSHPRHRSLLRDPLVYGPARLP